ncbi:hypothetical protein ACA30_07080 [Virgibacillus soli]|nr:hypothetical protein ACA30_07080 [Virgibacillus soli]
MTKISSQMNGIIWGNENHAIIIKRVSKIAERLKKYYEGMEIALFAQGTLNQYLIRELIGLANSQYIHFSGSVN